MTKASCITPATVPQTAPFSSWDEQPLNRYPLQRGRAEPGDLYTPNAPRPTVVHTHKIGAMASGRRVLRPGPGMPGVLGRLPCLRRRGCRRPLRTWRTARSRRSATRRLRPAGPAQFRRGRPLRPGLRTGASRSAVPGRRTRAGTARVVPPGAAARPGWPRTSPARPRRAGTRPADRQRHAAGPRHAGRLPELAADLGGRGQAGRPAVYSPGVGGRRHICPRWRLAAGRRRRQRVRRGQIGPDRAAVVDRAGRGRGGAAGRILTTAGLPGRRKPSGPRATVRLTLMAGAQPGRRGINGNSKADVNKRGPPTGWPNSTHVISKAGTSPC